MNFAELESRLFALGKDVKINVKSNDENLMKKTLDHSKGFGKSKDDRSKSKDNR